MIIDTKQKWYKLWNEGLWWNKPRTWNTIADYLDANFYDLVALRCVTKAGGPFIPNLNCYNLLNSMMHLMDDGWEPKDFQVSEMANTPNRTCLMNAFVMRSTYGLLINYALGNMLVREAVPKFEALLGMKAKQLLEKLLWHNDYENLMWSLDNFPDHVVEISVYDKCLGILPRSRMITWEVRRY